MHAVFLDYETVSDGDLDSSSLTGTMPGLQFYDSTDERQITERIAAADIVLLNKFVLSRDHLFAAGRLKLIASPLPAPTMSTSQRRATAISPCAMCVAIAANR